MSWTYVVLIKPKKATSYLSVATEMRWLSDHNIMNFKMRWIYGKNGELFAQFAFKRKNDALHFQLACG